MSHRLRYAQEAYDDISRNPDWWARHHSVEQAQRWFAAIHAKIDTLRTSPESHALADENPDYPHDLREALFGHCSRPGYRILFTVIEDAVIVLSIRAAEQDSLKPGDLPLPQ